MNPPDIAGSAGTTRIALATSLEECSAAILAGILRGEPMAEIRGGPEGMGIVPVLTPFRHIPACEIDLYTRIHGLEDRDMPATRGNGPLNEDVRRLLGEYTLRHPAAPHAILNLGEMLAAAAQETDAEPSKHRTVEDTAR